ncbi:MAG: hypothetical protein FGF50_08660 [Candidatus Brockarchaeota archaeon]|nr:hypothetical protein [Candidatus Brockarchaeota archaeon]
MDKGFVLNLALAVSVAVLVLNVPLFLGVFTKGESPYSEVPSGILLSLLPLALIVVLFAVFKRRESRLLWVALGVISLTMAYEFLADPWSYGLRAQLGLPIQPLLIYTLIGLMFLIIAVFVFRRVE